MDAHLTPSGRDLSVGTRVCLLVAGLFVIAAGYLLLAPLERASASGPPFDCGTALAPAGGDFARSVCGDLNSRRQLQTGAVLLGALVLAGGGRVAFGPVRRARGAGPVESAGPESVEAADASDAEAEDGSLADSLDVDPSDDDGKTAGKA